MSELALGLNEDEQRRHDRRNLLHTVLLVGGAGAFVAFIAWSVFGWTGLIWAAVFGAFCLWSAGRISPKVVLRLYQARPVSPNELRPLNDILRGLTQRADLPSVPQLHYIPTPVMNAFAVGKPEDSAIAVTDGLLRNLTLRQIAGVLAHEVAHIHNRDLKVMALGDVLARMTSLLSMAGLIGLFFSIPAWLAAGYSIPWLTIGLLLAAPTIGGLLQLALSRAREYDADLEAARLTGDPEGLASALLVLEQKTRRGWESLVLPGGRSPQPSLLRSHPATEDRVARLKSLKGMSPEPDTSTPVPHEYPVIAHRPRVRFGRMGLYY